MNLLILFSLFVLLTIVFYLVSTTFKPANFPPGPNRLPIFGNTFLIRKLSEKFGGQTLALVKLAKDFNTDILGFKLGPQEYIVVFGRKLVQQVFTHDEFQGRPDNFFARLRTMGHRRGITMTDGPFWTEQRNFVEKQLRQLGFGKMVMENLILDELGALLADLGDRREDISLDEKLSSAVLNVLWTITGSKQFSEDEDGLTELLTLLTKRCRAFDVAGGLLNHIPWLRFIMPDYCGYTCIKTLNAKLFALFQTIIDEHKRTLTADTTRDFIDSYLHEKERSKSENFTDEQLMAILVDLFIAGATTTSYSLGFAILSTVSNQRVQRKLHEEIDKVLPRGQLPSLAERARFPYVEALLLESQRLHHVLPTLGPRRTMKDTTIGEYNVPKNTVLLMSLHSIHYDSDRWSDPEVFRPERFLDANGELIQDEGLCHFGLGKRRCPGEVLAKSFLFLAFTALFHKYYISFPVGKEPPSQKPKAGILQSPQHYTVSLEIR